MVLEIETFKQKDNKEILKVWVGSKYDEKLKHYFYTDADALDLVKSYSWKNYYGYTTAMGADRNNKGKMKGYSFHREYMYQLLGEYPKCTDHINRIGIDNTSQNLRSVDFKENCRNVERLGYQCSDIYGFVAHLTGYKGKKHHYYADTEIEILALINSHKKRYRLKCEYSFLEDRVGGLDLLDLERTGQISHDEATYEYVLRHASKNPWYVYRFGLTGYCLRHNIPIPDFSIDNDGFMINKESGERLRPEYLLRN